MKRIYLLLSFAFIACVAYAQTPTSYRFANSLGTTTTEMGNGVCTDSDDNVIMVGYFKNTITTGAGNITSNGAKDAFVAKYDSAGTLLWLKNIGGAGDDEAYSVVCDDQDNIYVGGGFFSTSITDNSITVTNNGGQDMFLAKLSPSGTTLGIKAAGGVENDYIADMEMISATELIVTGVYRVSVNFGNSVTLTGYGQNDIFLLRIDNAGTAVWAKRAGSNAGDLSRGVSVDRFGNILLTGEFSGTCNFGGVSLTSTGQYDVYAAKYTNSGNLKWVKRGGGSSFDYSFAVDSDINGNVFTTGYYTSPNMTFGATTLSNSGAWDMFVTKYDSVGTLVWAKKFASNQYDYSQALVVDDAGSVIIAGGYGNDISFGSVPLTNTNANIENMFVAKLDNNGNGVWAVKASTADYSWANALALDSKSNILVTGTYETTCSFFSTNLVSNGGDEAYGEDAFVAKINQTIADNTPPIITLTGNDTVTVVKNGTYTEPGYSAYDDYDGDITSSVVVTNTADLSTVGIYEVKYKVTNNVGLADSAYRYINVVNPSGISKQMGGDNKLIYPTQVNSVSEIQFSAEVAYYTISNSNGAVSSYMNSKNTTASAVLPSGLYIIQLYDEDKSYMQSAKVVIK